MASSGKKGKKTKGKTVTLNDFLQDTSGPAPTIPIRKTQFNWADDVEDSYDSYDSRPKPNVILPTAPKAARGLDDYSDKIPQNPPYIAYLSNLPYDVDEQEIAEFFGDLTITNMRIPKDDQGSRLKGFGYVEFAERDGLLSALAIPDCTLKNRRIRIEVASSQDGDRRRGGRMEMGRDRGDRPEVSTGDWRSGPRSEVDMERRPMGGGFSRDSRDREGDKSGAWRDGSDRPTFRDDKFSRDGERRGFDRDGDRGGFDRDGDRRGYDRDGDRRGFDRDGERRGFDRDGDRRGFGRDGDRRGFGSRQDDRNGAFARGLGNRDDTSERSEPRQRPKLNLIPRSKPLEESASEATESSHTASVPSTSIFGSAKPVDTSAKERQIEERLAKENTKTDSFKEDRRKDIDRKRDVDRSPRRGSPERRRYSPQKYSPDRYPPERKFSSERGKFSNERQVYSSDRKYSPEGRGSSSDRRVSPDRRSLSGGRRSPNRRRTPDRNYSPEMRYSPDRYSSSESQSRRSPDRWGSSPSRKRDFPERVSRRGRSPSRSPNRSPPDQSPDGRKVSPRSRKELSDKRESSREHKNPPDGTKSPDVKKSSPKKITSPRRKTSPEKQRPTTRKNDGGEKKGAKVEKTKDKTKREHHERELPKLKKPEVPNFVGSNKYAFLSEDECE